MKNRADEVRRKYQNQIKSHRNNVDESSSNRLSVLNRNSNGGHPLFSSEGFLFRVMAAICLFLVIGIIFKNPSAPLGNIQGYVNNAFEEEFQFASVANWYENRFGKPLTLFPTDSKNKTADSIGKASNYALPANAKVLQSFKDNGKGVLLETGSNTDVSSIKEGFIIFIGEKEQLGKTVVVQHFDGSESWYGKLNKISEEIKLYNYIDAGADLGKVTKEEKSDTGLFYFAIKDNGGFIDPLKALSSD
ncbi:M23 family metallopeptidase [Pseudalkalibacillus berkeleyi]|uniref:M23 family metallopeptidase n=1 Tax=Pseudalkalibacillus berkeleyi TaxID=1069813 RepID=A0ABS9GZB2_9BACL|nr:M23 family metallopeptidase [Pseudalkalibacillus berkeleyi]MCF6138092.1 M23 family metallopeptidase [Pseudalkalibacillus berkeleyi]